MTKKPKDSPISPMGSKPKQPDLVETLIEIARHEESIIAEIGKAVASGNKDRVFELAKQLVELKAYTPVDIDEWLSTIPPGRRTLQTTFVSQQKENSHEQDAEKEPIPAG